MGYIYQYDKRFDVTYVYEKVTEVNPLTNSIKTRRKIVGKLDKATNTIIPTGKRGRKPNPEKQGKKEISNSVAEESSDLVKGLRAQIAQSNIRIQELDRQVQSLTRKQEELRNWIAKGKAILD